MAEDTASVENSMAPRTAISASSLCGFGRSKFSMDAVVDTISLMVILPCSAARFLFISKNYPSYGHKGTLNENDPGCLGFQDRTVMDYASARVTMTLTFVLTSACSLISTSKEPSSRIGSSNTTTLRSTSMPCAFRASAI